MIKGAFKDYNWFAQLLLLVGSAIMGAFIFSFIAGICIAIHLIAVVGVDASFMESLTDMTAIMGHPGYMRILQFFGALGTYLFPAILCAYLFSDDHKKYLHLGSRVNPKVWILTILCAVLSIPVINFTSMLNQQMVLPEWLSGIEQWMRTTEEANAKTMEIILTAHSGWEIVQVIIVVAVLAGISEEFLFRGTIQSIIGKAVKNQHLVIWIAAIIFSAIHMQFYGFLPRMLMGAYFGYLLLYTRSIWVPVLAHFVNNLISVGGTLLYKESPEKMEYIDSIGWGDTWWIALASLSLFLFILFRIKRNS